MGGVGTHAQMSGNNKESDGDILQLSNLCVYQIITKSGPNSSNTLHILLKHEAYKCFNFNRTCRYMYPPYNHTQVNVFGIKIGFNKQ